MTEGGSQGIFVVVAVVIFGIFVGISYLLYRDQMSPALAKLFCDAITMTSERTGFASGLKGCDIKGSKDPIVVSYHKIREADDTKGWSEVWVQIHELDNGNVEIIDSGNQDLFEDETYGKGLIGEISFPDQIDGKDVEIIGKSALQYAQFSMVMKLPSELIILDSYSLQQSRFSGNAIFPEKIEIIGTEALRDSRFSGKLTDLPPSIIEIGKGAFQESTFEGEFVFPEGDKNFEGSASDGSVGGSIPDSDDGSNGGTGSGNGSGGTGSGSGTGSGGSGSGSGSGKYTPNPVIGDESFENSNFTGTIKIPDYITDIGDNAFGNSNFDKIVFPKDSALEKIGDNAFGNSNIKGEVLFPYSVKEIGDDSFKNSNFDKIIFPKDSVLENIGDGAFENSVTGGILWLPDTVKRIGDRAFLKAQFINSNWKLPRDLEFIGDSAFQDGRFRGSLYTNKKLKHIGNKAFEKGFMHDAKGTLINYKKISSKRSIKNVRTFDLFIKPMNIYMEDSLEYIGDEAFSFAKFQTEFVIPMNLKHIGKSAFRQSYSDLLVDIEYTSYMSGKYYIDYLERPIFKFNEKIEYIGEGAFWTAHFKDISETVPYALESIEKEAFRVSFYEGKWSIGGFSEDVSSEISLGLGFNKYFSGGWTPVKLPDTIKQNSLKEFELVPKP